MEHSILREIAPEGLQPQLTAYAGMLASDGRRLGLVGFPPSEAERQVARALLLAPRLLDGPFLDVGSGAGLPGLPLGLLRPGLGHLLEPRRKAIAFLEKARRKLDADFSVIHARAEEHAMDGMRYQTILARALAEPLKALELCAPLAAPDGRILLTAAPERVLDVPEDTRERLGLGEPSTEKLAGALELTQWVHIIPRSADRPPKG